MLQESVPELPKATVRPLSISLSRASEITGLSEKTLRREITKGTLLAVRVGRRLLVRTETLEKFLALREVDAKLRAREILHGSDRKRRAITNEGRC